MCLYTFGDDMLREMRGLQTKASCFALQAKQLILPAFFTWCVICQLGIKDCRHLFVIAEDELGQVK